MVHRTINSDLTKIITLNATQLTSGRARIRLPVGLSIKVSGIFTPPSCLQEQRILSAAQSLTLAYAPFYIGNTFIQNRDR